MNKFDLVCGSLLAGLGAYTFFAKPRAPRVSGVVAGTMSVGAAVENAATQRRSGIAVAFLGACLVFDGFGVVAPTFTELGFAVLFAASAWEYRLDARRLKDAGVAPTDRKSRWKKAAAVLSDVAAALFLLGFVAQFVGPFKS